MRLMPSDATGSISARRLNGPPVPPVEVREVAPVPRLAQPRRAQVPIRADLTRRCTQVLPQIVDRRPTPVPVAVIDAVNDQSRLEHERVRNHRIMLGVGVLRNVEVFLDRPFGIREKGPLGANRGSKLLKRVVRATASISPSCPITASGLLPAGTAIRR